MSDHEIAQREHYAKQYAEQKLAMQFDGDTDLWDWAKWYPLIVFEGFLATLSGKSALLTCCGAGRELGLLHKHGIRVTATDLTVDHLAPLAARGIVQRVEVQNAERLTYPDESFDYSFVNAGLHHLSHPHAGLCELLRTARDAAVFIESQDSILHGLGRLAGRRGADFEPAGNYVYRWKNREIEKIALSAHLHSYAIKTAFLPVMLWMRGVTGWRKRASQQLLDLANIPLAPLGNLLICVLFKQAPARSQVEALRQAGFSHRILTNRYPR